MNFQIDFKSGKPVYLQLVDQVRHAAAAGVLRAGDVLPSIRPLAEELRVNRNTVAKAYSELESLGIVESEQGKGCFIRANATPYTKPVREKLLIKEIDQAIVAAHHLKIDRRAFVELVDERLDEFEARLSKSAKAAASNAANKSDT